MYMYVCLQIRSNVNREVNKLADYLVKDEQNWMHMNLPSLILPNCLPSLPMVNVVQNNLSTQMRREVQPVMQLPYHHRLLMEYLAEKKRYEAEQELKRQRQKLINDHQRSMLQYLALDDNHVFNTNHVFQHSFKMPVFDNSSAVTFVHTNTMPVPNMHVFNSNVGGIGNVEDMMAGLIEMQMASVKAGGVSKVGHNMVISLPKYG